MRFYKCIDCTHEESYKSKLSECFICGSSKIIFFEKKVNFNISIDKNIFSSTRFVSSIQNYCARIGWKIDYIDNDRAILRFGSSPEDIQTIFVIRHNVLDKFGRNKIKFINHDHFAKVIIKSIQDCDSFEKTIKKMLK